MLGTALVLGECSFLRLSLLLRGACSLAPKPREEEEARRNRMSRGRRPLVSSLLLRGVRRLLLLGSLLLLLQEEEVVQQQAEHTALLQRLHRGYTKAASSYYDYYSWKSGVQSGTDRLDMLAFWLALWSRRTFSESPSSL